MRQCRWCRVWEAVAIAGLLATLLLVSTLYLRHPELFHVLESRGLGCGSRPCLRKCCPRGESLQQPNPNLTSGCFPTTSHFSISDIPRENGSGWDDGFDVVSQNCVKSRVDEDDALILEDGSVQIDGKVVSLSEYCIDFKIDKTYVFLCSEEENEEISESFVFGFVFSSCFLCLTLAVYLGIYTTASVRQRLQISATHLSVILNYLPSLLCAYVLLSVIYENPFNLNADHFLACRTIAFIVQFSFLASFFWLNVMCFDIWLVFSNMKPVQGKKHKKFLVYSLYAWGVPLTIVAISVGMDMIPGIPDTYIKPRFGEQKCWFADNKGTLLYFYLPIAVVVVSNIVMFVSTAIKLRAHTRATKVLNTSESRRTNENDRDRFNLYLKLFIIMGINWVMELISFFVGGRKSLWFVTDLGNTLQGVLIFVIFVCKRRILRLLNEKLCPQWTIVRDTSTSGRSKVSSSRTNSTSMSKTICEHPDSVVLKPIARSNHDESDG